MYTEVELSELGIVQWLVHEPACSESQRPAPVLSQCDDLAPLFHDINAEWIAAMLRLEDTGRAVPEHPRASIVEAGDAVLFVNTKGLGTT